MATKRAKTGSPERARVMVVDPKGKELNEVCAHLRGSGLTVVELTRAEAALPLARYFRPDVALLATTAPQFAEISLGKQLRFVSGGALPLFYLVDKADSFSRTYVMQNGYALDVFERPVAVEELTAKLIAHVNLKRSIERAAIERADLRMPQLRDELTGLKTREYFMEAVASELRRCERYGGSFSILVARIDGLTRLRRLWGTEKAQRSFTCAAATFTQTVREADLAARISPTEFAVLLAKAPSESVSTVLGRLTERLEAQRVDRLAFSLGTVSFPDITGTPLQLLEAALSDLGRSRARNAMLAGVKWAGKGEARDV
ncbi:MAG: GGDEF domain-containing protein [Myxococcaceae bacterium]